MFETTLSSVNEMTKRKDNISNVDAVWVDLHYVDIVGRLHSVTVTYDRAMKADTYFDGSSVGFLDISDSDLHLVPDLKTMKRLPWDPNRFRVISDIWLDGGRFWGDCRAVADRASEAIRSAGYTEKLGAEVEFFVHKVKYVIRTDRQYLHIFNEEYPPAGPYPPKTAYEAPDQWGGPYGVRMLAAEYLRKMGTSVSIHHHEVAPNQVEIATPSGKAKEVADHIITVKYVAKKAASDLGYVANFMPKPLYGDNGSGMHVHFSLWVNGTNVFSDEESDEGISQIGRYFIGGVLEHGRSLSALVAPTVNSYKRLVPGYEAPIYLAWGIANRSAAVRVPRTRDPRRKRAEFRVPDPLSNPYLALAAILMAGLDGIKKKIDPGDPVKKNLYEMSEWELREHGIRTLPRNLLEAIEELASDNLYLKPVFSNELVDAYIEAKKKEAISVNSVPSPAEFAAYMWW